MIPHVIPAVAAEVIVNHADEYSGGAGTDGHIDSSHPPVILSSLKSLFFHKVFDHSQLTCATGLGYGMADVAPRGGSI